MTTSLAARSQSFSRLEAKRLEYHSYILRMWRQESCKAENADWRFAQEDVLTGKIVGSTSLESIFSAVAHQIGAEESQ